MFNSVSRMVMVPFALSYALGMVMLSSGPGCVVVQRFAMFTVCREKETKETERRMMNEWDLACA